MNTKEAFEDPRIVMLEEIILDEYEHGKQAEAEAIIKNALHHRWMILRELMQYDEESKRLLSDFNDRIKAAATALFNKTKTVHEGMMKLDDGNGDLEVEGKLKLGYNYPTAHPVQTELAETMWEVMTQGGYDRMYSTEGCSWSLRWNQNGIMSAHESLEAWLGMADENDNWNESLDYEWSKDMHLVYPFHNLYGNRHFSLYGLVYVSEFEFEICIRMDGGLDFLSIKPIAARACKKNYYFCNQKRKKMNTKNTLKIYEKKNGYQFFFIRKDLQPLFDNLGTFSLICSDGTHYSHLEVCKSGKVLRYFIYANEFFKEHPKLKKHDEIMFSIDHVTGIVTINPNLNE